MILDLVVPVWHESDFGINLNGRRYTHLVWADNIWLLSTEPDELQKMVKSMTAVLNANGSEWKCDSLMFMDTAVRQESEEGATLSTMASGLLKNIPRVDGMVVLGAWMDPQGSTASAVGCRLRRASAAFWSQSKSL